MEKKMTLHSSELITLKMKTCKQEAGWSRREKWWEVANTEKIREVKSSQSLFVLRSEVHQRLPGSGFSQRDTKEASFPWAPVPALTHQARLDDHTFHQRFTVLLGRAKLSPDSDSLWGGLLWVQHHNFLDKIQRKNQTEAKLKWCLIKSDRNIFTEIAQLI